MLSEELPFRLGSGAVLAGKRVRLVVWIFGIVAQRLGDKFR